MSDKTEEKRLEAEAAARVLRNPEIEKDHAARFVDGGPDDVGGTLYVTSGVPDMEVEVLPQQNVRVPEGDHVPGDAGDYHEGDKIVMHGPTAHMLEARGVVKILRTVGG